MKRERWLIVLSLAISSMALAQDELQGRVRAGMDFEPPLWVGQGARLNIEMMSTGFIFSNQDYAVPDVPGALVMQTSGSAVNLTEREGSETWQVLRYQVRIYPQRAGEIVIPPIAVSFSVSAGYGQEERAFSFQTDEIRFDALAPPGADPSIPVVTTTALEVSQNWDPNPVNLLVGHAIKRIVTMQAEDIPGMVLPPMPSLEIDGIASYPADPRVSTASNRGRLTGERTDELDLVFEQAGHYEIPGYVVQWWQPAREELTMVEIDALEIDVAPNPALEASQDELSSMPTGAARTGWWLLLALLVGVIAYKVWPLIAVKLADWRRRRADSEPAHFRRLADACRNKEPGQAYLMLNRWQARSGILLAEPNDALQGELRVLQEAIASGEKNWNGRGLLREISGARKQYLHTERDVASLLPPLNPGA